MGRIFPCLPPLHQMPEKKSNKKKKKQINYKGILAVSSSRLRSKPEMSEVVLNKNNTDALTGIVGPQRKGIFKHESMTNPKLCLNNKIYQK